MKEGGNGVWKKGKAEEIVKEVKYKEMRGKWKKRR
jgi:hypothetical protein